MVRACESIALEQKYDPRGAMPSRALARVGMLRRGEMQACLPDWRRESMARVQMAHGQMDSFTTTEGLCSGIIAAKGVRNPRRNYGI